MQNRYLFLGDSFWGLNPGTGDLLADLLLTEYPTLPLAFNIQSSPRNHLEDLYQRCARDIIGKQAGTTLLCNGWEDLRGPAPIAQICEAYHRLVLEIQNNSQTKLFLTTFPDIQLSEDSILRSKILVFNETVRAYHHTERTIVIDVAQEFARYQTLQQNRGALIRNLFAEDAVLGPMGQMLCARIVFPYFSRNAERFLLS